MKKFTYIFFAIFIASCMPNNKNTNEINIYSQRHYNVDEIQYKNFEKLTGIKVNVTKANADELIKE
jgi:spermidine/putrescine-binding protein